MDNALKYFNTLLLSVIAAIAAFMFSNILELKTNQGIIMNSNKYIEKDIAENKEKISAIEKNRFTDKDARSFKEWALATFTKK